MRVTEPARSRESTTREAEAQAAARPGSESRPSSPDPEALYRAVRLERARLEHRPAAGPAAPRAPRERAGRPKPGRARPSRSSGAKPPPAAEPPSRLAARAIAWAELDAVTHLMRLVRSVGVPWDALERVAANTRGGTAERWVAMQLYVVVCHAIRADRVSPARALALARHVLPALERGQLTIELPAPGAAPSGPAYLPDANTLRLPAARLDLADPLQRATLVHEAQHVVQDAERRAGTALDFERDAYGVQAEYLLRDGGAVTLAAGGMQLDAGHLQRLLGAGLNPVERERVWSGFWELAAENVRAGRPALNGPELDGASTLAALDTVRTALLVFPVAASFDTAYPKLVLAEARRRGEPAAWEDVIERLRDPYRKDGLEAPLPVRASSPGVDRLEPMTVQVHGVDLALACDRGRVSRSDLDGVVRALTRFPPAWLTAAAARAERAGRALPRIVLCDSATFAALHPRHLVDAGWYDDAHDQVVVNVERVRGDARSILRHPDGRPFDGDDWLEHTVIHELAHALDQLGGDGGAATDQGRPRGGGGSFARAVRARNSSLDPADYVSAYDRRRNMALDDALAEPHELFAEIVHVIVTEGPAGRDRLRARPLLKPLVDAVERYLSCGLRAELLGPGPA